MYKNILSAKPSYYAQLKIKCIRLEIKVIRITYWKR